MASILCRKGETFPNSHRHSSVAEVRECQIPQPRPFTRELGVFGGRIESLAAPGMTFKPVHEGRVDPELESQVPAGRYSIICDGTVKFYRVDKPTEGRWAGRTFVKVQASGEFYPVRNSMARAEILFAIAHDVRAASIRYGRELGVCGVCGRTLTNEESRAAGIGPVCAGRL
jgi:hypothetical protein